MHYNVEFSMTIETPYDTFVNSASMQRKFIEKLQVRTSAFSSISFISPVISKIFDKALQQQIHAYVGSNNPFVTAPGIAIEPFGHMSIGI
jgi:hypothetical protein